MTMNNKLNLFNIGLPTNEDLNTWSKDCIKQRLDYNINGNLLPFVSEAPDYERIWSPCMTSTLIPLRANTIQ